MTQYTVKPITTVEGSTNEPDWPLQNQRLGFLGGPVAKTHFPRREHGFAPWSGKFHTPHAARKKKQLMSLRERKKGRRFLDYEAKTK